MRRVAVPAVVGQLAIVTFAGALVGHAFGWTAAGSCSVAAITSTVVRLRTLAERRELHTLSGHLAIGWPVVEDVLTVLVLVLPWPARRRAARLPERWPRRASLGALVAFTLIAGGRAIPWLLQRVVATKSRELFTLVVLTLALGVGARRRGAIWRLDRGAAPR